MTSLIKDKISSLDSEILSTAKAGDFTKQAQKLKTQKSLEEILQKREDAEQSHQKFPATNLEEDALYQAAKEAEDEETMKSIENRKLTKAQYQALSEKYKVNQDVVDYDPQDMFPEEKKIAEVRGIGELLLNKPNMTSTDKENMQKSITYLEEKGMDIQKNLKKLDAINYGSNYIEIGGVKFSREKLVPQVKFNKKPNKYDVFESDKKWVFKAMYNGKEEYHLTIDAYIDESKKQWKKAINNDHIRQALQALPGEYADNKRYEWANILWNILNLSISGYVESDGQLWDGGRYGYLCSVSPVDTDGTRAFGFDKGRGRLGDSYIGGDARPCLFVVE